MRLSGTRLRRWAWQRSAPRRGRRLRLGFWLSGLAVAGIVGSAVPAASAEAPPTAAGSGSSAFAGSTARVTLITGDTVELPLAGDRTRGLLIQPATRHHPAAVSFEIEADARGKDVYVVPSDVEGLVEQGVVDRELFNVGYLVESGYADAARASMPVIVEYSPDLSRSAREQRARDLPASTVTHTLESLDAAGLAVNKSNAKGFWASLRGDGASSNPSAASLAAGVAKVWLDRNLTIVLDESVPQIGAPEAWASGYDGSGVKVAVLDTGIDANHLDVAGKILASRSFISNQAVADGNGHGTHVASTIAGTGAAQGGTYKGVAVGAALTIGKVCTNAGSCPASSVIDGMEWAALEQGVDVVNMSLGGCCTDGTDAMSRSVNELTTQTGTLFVIAAGNAGPRNVTIASPGAADAALTVGAVSKEGVLASFSSRGPRLRDAAIKPEITAPGVGIVAARAAGTSAGVPVDGTYTSLSGTSMATPHVAGAAAILAQRHAGWGAPQLKAALVGSAVDNGFTIYEQGSGRVDLAQAIRQDVYAGQPTLNFGLFAHQAQPATRALTYHNDGDQPVALELTVSMKRNGVQPVPDGTIELGGSSLIVPAHGQATLDVTVDPARAGAGLFGGIITARDSGGTVTVRTPVGHHVGGRQRAVTLRLLNREGNPVADESVDLERTDVPAPAELDPFAPVSASVRTDSEGLATASIGEGIYEADTIFDDYSPGGIPRRSYLSAQEIDVRSGDAQVTLDGRQAIRLGVSTDRPTEEWRPTYNITRRFPDGTGTGNVGLLPGPDFYAMPRPPFSPTKGSATIYLVHNLVKPRLQLEVKRPGPDALVPTFTAATATLAGIEGTRKLPLVFLGDGDQGDFDGIDARGKVVLVRLRPPADLQAVEQLVAWASQQRPPIAVRAAAEGAALALFYVDRPDWQRLGGNLDTALPTAGLPQGEGDSLRRQVENEPTTIQVTGTKNSPYAYTLSTAYDLTKDGIRSVDAKRHFGSKQLATIPIRLHGEASTSTVNIGFVPYGSHQIGGIGTLLSSDDPRAYTQYVGPAGPDTFWWIQAFQRPSPLARIDDRRTFDHSGHYPQQEWFEGPTTAGYETISDATARHPIGAFVYCGGCRDGDRFDPTTLYRMDADAHHRWDVWGIGALLPGTFRLYRADGTEIPMQAPAASPLGNVGYFVFPTQESATYRLENQFQERPTGRVIGSQVDTTWIFQSQRPPAAYRTPQGHLCSFSGSIDPSDPNRTCRQENLIGLTYDLDLDLLNRASADHNHTFDVTAAKHPAADRSPIAGMKVWASTDDGASWRSVKASRDQGGTFRVSVKHPDLERTSGFVSLRVHAWDKAGNRVEQTVRHAYTLRDGHKHDDNDDDD